MDGDHNTTAFGSGAAHSATVDHASVSGGGALSAGGEATGEQHNTDNHEVHQADSTTKVDIDHAFNEHDETTTGSHNSNEGHFASDSHDESVSHVQGDNTLHDVHPV